VYRVKDASSPSFIEPGVQTLPDRFCPDQQAYGAQPSLFHLLATPRRVAHRAPRFCRAARSRYRSEHYLSLTAAHECLGRRANVLEIRTLEVVRIRRRIGRLQHSIYVNRIAVTLHAESLRHNYLKRLPFVNELLGLLDRLSYAAWSNGPLTPSKSSSSVSAIGSRRSGTSPNDSWSASSIGKHATLRDVTPR